MFKGLMAVLAVMVMLCGSVCADGLMDKMSATAFAAPNSQSVLGAGVSYEITDSIWADLGNKRCDVGTDTFLGFSTDLNGIGSLLSFTGINIGSVSDGTRVGAGYLLRESDWMVYVAQKVMSF